MLNKVFINLILLATFKVLQKRILLEIILFTFIVKTLFLRYLITSLIFVQCICLFENVELILTEFFPIHLNILECYFCSVFCSTYFLPLVWPISIFVIFSCECLQITRKYTCL